MELQLVFIQLCFIMVQAPKLFQLYFSTHFYILSMQDFYGLEANFKPSYHSFHKMFWLPCFHQAPSTSIPLLSNGLIWVIWQMLYELPWLYDFQNINNTKIYRCYRSTTLDFYFHNQNMTINIELIKVWPTLFSFY